MTNMQMIEMHINPLIGKVKMQKLTPKHIDVMFMELRQKKVTGSKARNKKEEDIPYISSTMQRHIYTLLHGAMEKAVEWKVIPSNPVVCDPPPRSTTETATWDIDTLRMALDMMEDEILHLAVHLSFVCSLRIGEAMALSWDDVNLEKKEIYIRKTLQRVDKKALEELPGDSLYFMFPPKQLEKKSVLVLKKPKTNVKQTVTRADGTYPTTANLPHTGVNQKIGENGNYFIANVYWNNTYKVLSNRGGNLNSIGIETCVNYGTDLHLTWATTAKLIGTRLLPLNALTPYAVKQHNTFDGKNCPQVLLAGNYWAEFMKMIEAE